LREKRKVRGWPPWASSPLIAFHFFYLIRVGFLDSRWKFGGEFQKVITLHLAYNVDDYANVHGSPRVNSSLTFSNVKSLSLTLWSKVLNRIVVFNQLATLLDGFSQVTKLELHRLEQTYERESTFKFLTGYNDMEFDETTLDFPFENYQPMGTLSKLSGEPFYKWKHFQFHLIFGFESFGNF